MIELRILGEIRLQSDNGVQLDALLRQPKRLALLAYLASPCPGTWHRRDMLLALFWPELDTSHARTSLRNSLYVLRQSLGDDVLRNRGDEEISIDPAKMKTDLTTVWDALRRGDPEAALSEHRGELLPGLFPQDSEGFQRWLDLERTRLKVALSTAGTARIDELERDGNLPQALAVTRRVMDIQPDDETLVRRLMILQEKLGDRAGALAAFESYRLRLASDFDAEPAPETVEVASRLRASSPANEARSRTPVSTRSRAPSESALSSNTPDTAPVHSTIERTTSPNRRYLLIAAIILVAGTVGAFAFNRIRAPAPPSIGKSSPLTADEGLQVEAAISPDGRFVAYAKGNANQLRIFVQKIGAGAPWALSGDSAQIELMPRWSPQQDEILFLARNNAYASPWLGGSARIIAKGTEGDGMVRSASWSPTGDSIAIVRNDSLMVQPLEGHASRFIGQGRQLHSCVWSPNGKWIACISGNLIATTPGPLFGNDATSAILMYPVAGGNPVEFASSEFANENPTWSPDGNFLWLTSDRDGSTDETYAVPVGSDGRASGRAVKVGLKSESISLSAGRIAFSVPTKKANIWSMPIPRDTPVTLASATQVTSGTQVIELLSASRDGQWLIYDSNLHGNADIYRLRLPNDTPERLTDDPRREYAPELSPDGRELAWHRFRNAERRLMVKRLDSDAAEEILPDSGDQGVPHWSPDGSSILAWHHDKERGAVFVVKRNAAGKWQRPAWRLKMGQLPVWSPDGRSIAFVLLDGSVQMMPADSGALRTLYSPRPGTTDPLAIFLLWSPDPDIIWVMGQGAATQGLWSLSIHTGRLRPVVRVAEPFGRTLAPSFTTDGSKFYFSLNERVSNIRWAELVRQ
jgi:Tol biopolymer transport system component/DNA-binding SARP family transcriptional activator